jgi:hypothetical protein
MWLPSGEVYSAAVLVVTCAAATQELSGTYEECPGPERRRHLPDVHGVLDYP